MEEIKADTLVRFLKSFRSSLNSGYMQRIKFFYRPYICPYTYLLKHIEPGAKVFDLGFGSGQFSVLTARFSAASAIAGAEVDVDKVRLIKAIFNHSDLNVQHEFTLYNGIDLPASFSESDQIFLIDVIHHVPLSQQQSFLEKIFQSMKKGAKLIIKDIDRGSILVYFNKLHDLLVSGRPGEERTMKELISMAENSGFRLIEQFRKNLAFYPHFTLIMIK